MPLADAGVDHVDEDVLARLDLIAKRHLRQRGPIERFAAGRHRDHAMVVHRFRGVDNQVQHHLANLRRVGLDQRQRARCRSSVQCRATDAASRSTISRPAHRDRRAPPPRARRPNRRASSTPGRPRAAPIDRSPPRRSSGLRRRLDSCRSALPRMPVNRLLKSCATPPASTIRQLALLAAPARAARTHSAPLHCGGGVRCRG